MDEYYSAAGVLWQIQPERVRLAGIPILDTLKVERPDAHYLIHEGHCYIGEGVVVSLWARALFELFGMFAEAPDIEGELAILVPFTDGQCLSVTMIGGRVEQIRWAETIEQSEGVLRGYVARDRALVRIMLPGQDTAPLPLPDDIAPPFSVPQDYEDVEPFISTPAKNRWLIAGPEPTWPPLVPTKFACAVGGSITGGLAGLMSIAMVLIGLLAPPPIQGVGVVPDVGYEINDASTVTTIAPQPEILTGELDQSLTSPVGPVGPPASIPSVRWDLAAFTLMVESSMWRDLRAENIIWQRFGERDVTVIVSGPEGPRWDDAAALWDAVVDRVAGTGETDGSVRIIKQVEGNFDRTDAIPFDPPTHYCVVSGGVSTAPRPDPLPTESLIGGLRSTAQVAPTIQCRADRASLGRWRANNQHAPGVRLGFARCQFGPHYVLPQCDFRFDLATNNP